MISLRWPGQKIAKRRGMAGRVRSVILSRKHEDRDIKVSGRNSGRTTMWPPRKNGRLRTEGGVIEVDVATRKVLQALGPRAPCNFCFVGFKGHVVTTSSIS